MKEAPAASRDESRFEILFAQSPFSMQLLASDGRTLRVNRAWEALWQLTDEDGVKAWVLGGEYNVLADPQLEAKGVTPYLRRAFAGEAVAIPPVLYDPAELGRAGRARWVRAGAHPILGEGGRVTEVMLIHEDITDRYESERALREQEQRLRLATDAAKIGIWDWDIDGDRVTWTPEVYALHGLAPGTFGETSRAFAERVHRDDVAEVWGRIQEAVATETGFSAEFRVSLPEGGERWLSTSSRAYRGPDGGRRMVGATFSIDPYKKAESALRDSDRRKDEFLAMLAHELRNPLAPIRSAAELLVLGRHEPDRVEKASQVIVRQVAHVTRLLEDLLDVSRVTRGLVELEIEPVIVADVARAAMEQAQPLADARGHSLRARIEASTAVVEGDRARLVQVVVNLLANAARYTPKGGHIELGVRAEAESALITVVDDGQGIEPSLLPHIFDLFTQGSRTLDRSAGGLGIGLALVRRLVELHRGSITARSAGPGMGSAFTVSLPLSSRRPLAPPAQSPSAGRSAASATIVVVDDNRDAADSLAMLLHHMGHSAQAYYSASAALESATSDAADVFFLDIGLPDMDGLELAKRLRGRNPGALFVATSGYGQPSDIAASRAAGFDSHLVKPVGWEQVSAAISARRSFPA